MHLYLKFQKVVLAQVNVLYSLILLIQGQGFFGVKVHWLGSPVILHKPPHNSLAVSSSVGSFHAGSRHLGSDLSRLFRIFPLLRQFLKLSWPYLIRQ